MIDVNLFFLVIICTLSSILLIALIILVIKLIKTVSKIDKVVDDVTDKSSKLDGIFNLVETTTDALSSVGDKVVGTIYSIFSNAINKKRKNKEEQDYE
ncbi:MAG: hypothetical protein PHN42_04860 [Bacilli bacterium]|nr:hypothetical protein [Bacilli bacterium]